MKQTVTYKIRRQSKKGIRFCCLACCIFLFFTLFSCVTDEKEVIFPTDKNIGKDLLVTIQIPGTSVPVSYSNLSEEDENDIHTLDVLLFREGEEGEYFYKYVPVPTLDEDNGTVKKFRIKKEPFDVKLLVLANVCDLFTSSVIEQLRLDSIQACIDKETIMRRFLFSYTEIAGGKPFPMYGESEIIQGEEEKVEAIKMTRAVARIDIGTNGGCSLAIDSVFIFNCKNKGYVSPPFSSKGSVLEEPWVPINAVPYSSPFGFAFRQNSLHGNAVMMERNIYITEDTQSSDKPTIIVIKTVSSDAAPVYYRVNMQDVDGSFIPIRRNYRYRICITEISAHGYASALEASKAPASLQTVIESYELDIHEMIVDEKDRYMLGVSTTEVVVNADGSWAGKAEEDQYYMLRIHTTYPKWSATWEKKDFDGWLTFFGNTSEEDIIRMEYPSSVRALPMKLTPNPSTQERSGIIKLIAGTLVMEIRIAQKGQFLDN